MKKTTSQSVTPGPMRPRRSVSEPGSTNRRSIHDGSAQLSRQGEVEATGTEWHSAVESPNSQHLETQHSEIQHASLRPVANSTSLRRQEVLPALNLTHRASLPVQRMVQRLVSKIQLPFSKRKIFHEPSGPFMEERGPGAPPLPPSLHSPNSSIIWTVPLDLIYEKRKFRETLSEFEVGPGFWARRDPFIYLQPVGDRFCNMFMVLNEGKLYHHINFMTTRFLMTYNAKENGDVTSLTRATREDGDFIDGSEVSGELSSIIKLNCKITNDRLRKVLPIADKINKQIEGVVSKFQEGKYRKYMEPKRLLSSWTLKKFKRLNIYASVLYECGLELYNLCCKLQQVLTKALAIDPRMDIPAYRRVEPVQPHQCSWKPTKVLTPLEDFDRIIGTQKIMLDVINEFPKIPEIIAHIKKRVKSLKKGIKVDRKYQAVILLLIDAFNELDPNQDIRLDAIIVTLASISGLLRSNDMNLPNINLEFRSQVLQYLSSLSRTGDRLVKVTKTIPVYAFFVAQYTLAKMLRMKSVKRLCRQRIKLNKAKKAAKKLGAANVPEKTKKILEREPALIEEETRLRRDQVEFRLARFPVHPLKFEGQLRGSSPCPMRTNRGQDHRV